MSILVLGTGGFVGTNLVDHDLRRTCGDAIRPDLADRVRGGVTAAADGCADGGVRVGT